MNWFKRLNYRRKRRIVAKRIIQRGYDKISIDVFNKISDNFESEFLKKKKYGYKYGLISIIKVVETGNAYEGAFEYYILSINGDEIESGYNKKIFDLLKSKYFEVGNERLMSNIKSL